MRPLPLLLAGAVLLVCAAPRSPEDLGEDPTSPAPLAASPATALGTAPRIEGAGCKPTAPIALRVEAGTLGSNGVARLDYEVELLHDALDAWVEVHLPTGGEVIDQAAPLPGPAARGEIRDGSARVRLPALRGVVELEAVMVIEDATEPSGRLRLSNTESVRYGELELELELPELVVEGETSVVAPSIVRPGGGR